MGEHAGRRGYTWQRRLRPAVLAASVLAERIACRLLAQAAAWRQQVDGPPRARITHRATADLGPLELAHLDADAVLAELRRIGWGEP